MSASASTWPPIVRWSVALHGVALGALVLAPQRWPIIAGACIADHVLLFGSGLVPRSRWLGPNVTQLGPESMARREVALTFDDGPDPRVTPRLLERLAVHGVRATFFVIGARAVRHPQIVRDIVAAGHAVENHTASHSSAFYFYTPGALRRELETSQDQIASLTGRRPTLFRAPAGLRSPLLQRELVRQQLRLVSWSARAFDTVATNAQFVARRMLPAVQPGAILVFHDGGLAAQRTEPIVLAALPRLFERMAHERLHPIVVAEGLT